MRINLGCGKQSEDGFVNVDSRQMPGVDKVHDLNVFPWPFESECADRIKAFDVLEHVCAGPLVIDFMAECHRILVPGGLLMIHTAHWRSPNAYTDMTHIRACTESSFDYWIPGTYLHDRYDYAQGCTFEKVRLYLDGGDIAVTLRKL